MRGKKNKLLKQSFCIIGLITSISIEADSSLNSSLNKHQETFENAAMTNLELGRSGLSRIQER
jgi:hypothetical protein